MGKLNFLYCSNSHLPSKAAYSIHVMQMAASFSHIAGKVGLIAKVAHSIKKEDIFEFYHVKSTFYIYDISKISLLKKIELWYIGFCSLIIALKHKPEIIYGRSLHSILFLSLCGFKGGYETHSPENGTKFNKFLFRAILKNKNITKVVTKSEALRQIIIAEFGEMYSSKIVSIHDAAPLSIIVENEKYKVISDDRGNIGYVGHLYKGRGVQLILDLALGMPEFVFHIVGGKEEDIEYWKKQVDKSGSNIVFYGFVEPRYIPFIRSQMDILIAPYENKVSVSGNKGDTSKYMSPLKIFEYMSSKKPIVTSNHDVLKEVLEDHVDARLIDVNDLDLWKKTIINLFKDKILCEKLAASAFQKFQSNYTWDIRAQKIYNILSER